MAKATQPETPGFFAQLKQLPMVFSFTAKRDKLFVPLIAVMVLVVAGATTGLFFAVSWFAIPLGVMLLVLGALIVLNLRANRAYLTEVADQPGAAAGIVESMRGDFRVTPALASTTQMDFVHLVICRGGVVLLGEGNPGRVRGLMGQERKRLAKVIGSADLRDFIIGNGEGQLPLSKLRSTLLKLPRTLASKDVNAIDKRIKALNARPAMPKGAIPKNMRPPKGAFRAMRGGPR
jgi:Domain of unknown function (DUF4191)